MYHGIARNWKTGKYVHGPAGQLVDVYAEYAKKLAIDKAAATMPDAASIADARIAAQETAADADADRDDTDGEIIGQMALTITI